MEWALDLKRQIRVDVLTQGNHSGWKEDMARDAVGRQRRANDSWMNNRLEEMGTLAK